MIDHYWAQASEHVLRDLDATSTGLTSATATERLHTYGPNLLHEERPLSRLRVLGRQLASPLLLLLVFAAA